MGKSTQLVGQRPQYFLDGYLHLTHLVALAVRLGINNVKREETKTEAETEEEGAEKREEPNENK